MKHSVSNHHGLSVRLTTTLLCSSLLSFSVLANCDAPIAQQEREIGAMVQAIDRAIAAPQTNSLEIIYQYGTDSRYYVMIRGWLVQELAGVNSQLEAYKQQDEPRRVLEQKVSFLQQAIRRIDLE
ncbi:hypothetical protein JK628_19435 [Shewanella sp. KX20019]|uniref:hypothetical protein n=1 Tax=Shewanella sp. KX20019 TaxID=2803864 RepID=UPI0019295EC1|nr:hypothetical protein [Shewanella sp. KX20019]QQX79662.1 hypothetical protein JK628_19435 [Shewanella sp. KX20019]